MPKGTERFGALPGHPLNNEAKRQWMCAKFYEALDETTKKFGLAKSEILVDALFEELSHALDFHEREERWTRAVELLLDEVAGESLTREEITAVNSLLYRNGVGRCMKVIP